MGNCIKCGRDTKSSYEYYEADVASYDVKYHKETKISTTVYNNFVQKTGFLCYKCIKKFDLVSLGILIPVCLVFIAAYIINTGNIQGAIAFVFLIPLVVWFLYLVKGVKNDKKAKSGGFELVVMINSKRKKGDVTWAFTTAGYEELKKENNKL